MIVKAQTDSACAFFLLRTAVFPVAELVEATFWSALYLLSWFVLWLLRCFDKLSNRSSVNI